MSILYTQTTGQSAKNTASEISYSTGVAYTPADGYRIPGNFMVAGMVIELSAYGIWTDAVIPGTLRHRMRISDGTTSTLMADTGANAATAITGENYWESRFNLLCQTSGFGGIISGTGIVTLGLTPTTVQIWPISNVAKDFNLTAALYMELTTQWGTADPSNIFQWNAFFITIRAHPTK